MTLRVTRIQPDDWVRQRDLRLAALADAPETFGSTLARERAFDEDEWRRRAARPATFVATREGADVGTAGAYELDAAWCVMGMWVPQHARGTGVVDALVEACESVARAAGSDRLALWVMEDNPRGLRAYTRLGFTLTGEHQPFRNTRVQLAMTKHLPPTPTSNER